MQIKQQHLIFIALATLFSLVAVCLWLSQGKPKLGTVDLQVLLLEQSQNLAKTYPSGQVPPKVMQAIVESIKEIISDYGKAHKVTLLAKGAVITNNLPDYTAIFAELLSTTSNHLEN
mgnify:FL=1